MDEGGLAPGGGELDLALAVVAAARGAGHAQVLGGERRARGVRGDLGEG